MDWTRHKFKCLLDRPLDRVDTMVLDLINDRLPSDEGVLADFGFSQFDHASDQMFLFGLYRGLLKFPNVGDRKLHRWQSEGTLSDNITKFFKTLPESSRGRYFPWFLKHREQFNAVPKKLLSLKERAEEWFTPYLHLLDKDDPENLRDLEPWAKRYAFIYYASAMRQYHSRAEEPTWLHLGLCTARNEQEENQIAGMVWRLTQRCTFKEFWDVMYCSNLIALLDDNGFGDMRKSFPNFERVLNKAARSLESFRTSDNSCTLIQPCPVLRILLDQLSLTMDL